MSALIFEVLTGIVLFGALVRGGIWLACRISPELAQWSGLWAIAFVCSVIAPVLGVALGFLPDVELLPAAPALAVPHSLDALGLPMATEFAQAVGGVPRDWTGLMRGLAVIYGLGVMMSAIRLARGRHHVRRIVETADDYGMHDGIAVRVSANTVFAFAWLPPGMRSDRAVILLPALYLRELSAAQLDAIMHHEAAHIARRDDAVGLILRSLLCLVWLSPFAHSLFAGWSRSAELQCDRAVTAGRPQQMRRAYAETLLTALHIMADRVRQYPAAAFSTQRLRNEKMRIGHIMTGTTQPFKSRRHTAMLTIGALTLTVAGVGLTAHAKAPQAKAPAPHPATSAPDAPSPQAAPQAPSAPKTKASPAPSVVKGRVTARFGQSLDPFKSGQRRDHHGVDIAAPLGTPIHAPASATVQHATDVYQGKPAYGKVVVLAGDDGTLTLFSHLDSYSVSEGQRVAEGQRIATVGSSGKSTGPHVHIETYRDGQRVDPMHVWSSLND